jgi:hypothetical protein
LAVLEIERFLADFLGSQGNCKVEVMLEHHITSIEQVFEIKPMLESVFRALVGDSDRIIVDDGRFSDAAIGLVVDILDAEVSEAGLRGD